jgi:hypothetical protein
MVKASPIPGASPFLVFICLGTFAIGIIELLGSGSHSIPGVLSILYSCSLLLAFLRQRRTTGKLDQRRQRAASGDQSLLASEQMTPHQAELSLPATLKLRPQLLGALFVTVALMVLYLLVIFIALFIIQGITGAIFRQHFLFFLVFFLTALFIPILAMSFVFFLRSKRSIKVTANGLRVNDGSGVHYVPWNEARLFAIYMGKKNIPPTYYELSSAKDIVRWGWTHKFTNFSTEVPTVPVDEYHRQMQALLSLITAKTGLPLYDLR